MTITIKELGDRVNEFGNITDPYERAENQIFVERIHARLKEGGVWGWPAAQQTYRKVGAGFENVNA